MTICKPTHARQNQHSTVNIQDFDRVVDRPDNEDNKLTFLNIYFSFVLYISFLLYKVYSLSS